LHPDQRHAQMFEWVVSGPFAAVSHSERAFLAAAVHHRYAKAAPSHAPAYERLLTDDQRAAAAALGAAMRLGADISARTPSILGDFSLGISGGMLTLGYRQSRAHLVTEAATKRLEPLGNLLGVRCQIVSGLRR
jgi:exopolyphosphatase/guanosine-5'-triphosphate,3'-diphosphate pyrophosphatase